MATKRYDRIIIIAHSLGSMIGYDILNFAGQRHNKEVRAGISAKWLKERYPTARRLLLSMPKPQRFLDTRQSASARRHGWAKDREDFKRRVEEHEPPLCPPELDSNGKFSLSNKGKDGQDRQQKAVGLNQVAGFAAVNRANLYL
ncbi:hypothetical protein [Nitrosospira multiformis]|uniref:hypothetical protein n=1 Tax=Nitrosospira multiformis TaxID=1231 RepID=UPI0008988B4D|nr:hypothetical protein [Nitrosospira multiformis]SEA13165.1 hypothetical protein SAMN05216411_1053 [Nitrosospira multiformis]